VEKSRLWGKPIEKTKDLSHGPTAEIMMLIMNGRTGYVETVPGAVIASGNHLSDPCRITISITD
jgi:hypothetical protein